ncbi:MAG: hypothetical protein IKJ75_00300 [Clostridia bacterium]|nr:hypothetical protein [Clostridia bacterium]
MKKISTIFAALAILLTNIMCVVVTNLCTSGYHAEKHHFTSAPWEVGFLFIIPFAIAIIACSIVSYIAKKKEK